MRGLYLHFPYCRRKCSYCDFNSNPLKSGNPGLYLDALIDEIESYAAEKLSFSTVYFGGGTPSLIEPKRLRALKSRLFKVFRIEEGAEISIEMNPEQLEQSYLDEVRKLGFNRLSLGAQSFKAGLLTELGRGHSPRDTRKAVEMARKAGFENLNLDLIYGIPGQTFESFDDDLRQALKLEPEHLSIYALTLDSKVPLAKKIRSGDLKPVPEDLQADMYEAAAETMEEAGYRRYEISNYAKEGFECRHNLLYWKNEEYLGLGAGAHSYFNMIRFQNPDEIPLYISEVVCGNKKINGKPVSEAENARYELMLRLRLAEGVPINEFKEKTGHDLFKEKTAEIEYLKEAGLLVYDESLALTGHGMLLANEVISRLI